MFIPRGKPLHENLATSYVLLDALVDDLCEGGFSGIVEVTLRHLDGNVIVDAGAVAAALESRHTGRYEVTTVDALAAKSRRERGRISVYGLSSALANALASRVGAEALYTRLSTDFADLEKMVHKLSRERDRKWFIEVTTDSGLEALIHIKDGLFQVATAEHEASTPGSDHIDIAGNPVLRGLIEECNRVGGVFDVYSKSAFEPDRPTKVEPKPVHVVGKLPAPPTLEVETIDRVEEPAAETFVPAPTMADRAPAEEAVLSLPVEPEAPPFPELQMRASAVAAASTEGSSASDNLNAPDPQGFSNYSTLDSGPLEVPHLETEAFAETHASDNGASGDVAGDVGSQDELMADIKRLMGDIAQSIERAISAVEQRDSFPMYLRAGQLKIADRFPFLDPFGAEFEYLGGEIAFIGKANPQDFVQGLTEALRLASTSVVQTSTQGPRVKAKISEELRRLVDRNRTEFQRFGLDQSVERIIAD